MNVDSSVPLVTECWLLDRFQGQFFYMVFFMLFGHLIAWSLSELWPPFHLTHPVPYYPSLLDPWPYVLAASSMITWYKYMFLPPSPLSSSLWAPGLHGLFSFPGAYMRSQSESMHIAYLWMEAWDEQHYAYGYTGTHLKCMHASYF